MMQGPTVASQTPNFDRPRNEFVKVNEAFARLVYLRHCILCRTQFIASRDQVCMELREFFLVQLAAVVSIFGLIEGRKLVECCLLLFV